jgi:hypothetical protein
VHPEPVQAPPPTVTTLVVDVGLTVCDPEQALPSVAPLQVYVRSELAMEGPLAGEKSLAA